jgi:hypothetical protein
MKKGNVLVGGLPLPVTESLKSIFLTILSTGGDSSIAMEYCSFFCQYGLNAPELRSFFVSDVLFLCSEP